MKYTQDQRNGYIPLDTHSLAALETVLVHVLEQQDRPPNDMRICVSMVTRHSSKLLPVAPYRSLGISLLMLAETVPYAALVQESEGTMGIGLADATSTYTVRGTSLRIPSHTTLLGIRDFRSLSPVCQPRCTLYLAASLASPPTSVSALEA